MQGVLYIMDSRYVNPIKLIEEVKKRPALYHADNTDRAGKLELWREVGAAMFKDWETYDKATSYDRVLLLQKKWRCLRESYSRELRSRRTGVRVNRRVYVYFKRMSFLGGFEGTLSSEEEADEDRDFPEEYAKAAEDAYKRELQTKPKSKKVKKRSSPASSEEEMEMPIFPVEVPIAESEGDSDRLFMLSFLPQMRQLSIHVNMWARSQIANIMQEAVSRQLNNTLPGSSNKNIL